MMDYLNRYYLKNQGKKPIAEQCLNQFNDIYFGAVKKMVAESIHVELIKDREGQAINKDALKVAISCFVDMGLTQPKAMKVGNEIVWTGTKDLKMYINEFEKVFMIQLR